MRALHVMIFIFLFNVSISMIGVLHIYPMYLSSSLDPSDKASLLEYFGKGEVSDVIASFVEALAISSVYYLLTKQLSVQIAAISWFSTYFWTKTWDMFTILWSISDSVGMLMIIAIFASFVIIIFAIGIMQMVTGGLKTYE